MHLRPLTVTLGMLAASPVAAQDSAIRLFAPVPNGPSAIEQDAAEQASAQQADAIRLFSPVSNAPVPDQPAAPAIRGAVREIIPAEALPTDRTWTVALP